MTEKSKALLLGEYHKHTVERVHHTRAATHALRQLEPLMSQAEIDRLCMAHHVAVTEWSDSALAGLKATVLALLADWSKEVDDEGV